MTIKTKLLSPNILYVKLISGGSKTSIASDSFDMEAMKDYPPEAIESFKLKQKQGFLSASTNYIQTLDIVINEFCEKKQIKSENLIDIKYCAYGNENFDNQFALVIYVE